MTDSGSTRQETRLAQRRTIFIEVHSTYNGESPCKMLICESVDISANGFKARIDESLPLNAIYQLCVELHETDQRLYLSAQVKWLVEADDDGFYVGLEIFESDDTDIDKWKLYIADLL